MSEDQRKSEDGAEEMGKLSTLIAEEMARRGFWLQDETIDAIEAVDIAGRISERI